MVIFTKKFGQLKQVIHDKNFENGTDIYSGRVKSLVVLGRHKNLLKSNNFRVKQNLDLIILVTLENHLTFT